MNPDRILIRLNNPEYFLCVKCRRYCRKTFTFIHLYTNHRNECMLCVLRSHSQYKHLEEMGICTRKMLEEYYGNLYTITWRKIYRKYFFAEKG